MRTLSLHIENFKAIAKADIDIKGITVVSGVNSTGKSTLSRMLYYIVKLTLDYEKDRIGEIHTMYKNIQYTFTRLMTDLGVHSEKKDITEIRSISRNLDQVLGDIDQADSIFHANLNYIEHAFETRAAIKPFSENELRRIFNSLQNDFNIEVKIKNNYNLKMIFEAVRDFTVNLRKNLDITIKKRPLTLFNLKLASYFTHNYINVQLYEEQHPIIDRDENRLSNLFTISNVFYNDTPISIVANSFNRPFYIDDYFRHWEHLKRSISSSTHAELNPQQAMINEYMSKVIAGNISFEDHEYFDRFVYKRKEDNLIIDLVDSATGIKSFAILQLLLSQGLLNRNTLLILDEPEAHLHPQWIVEYARTIVLINKHLGVRFMIASHNPDMVSAIRYIAEKEGTLDDTNFYLAEEADNHQYEFKNLGVNIDPIFDSFNIALDKIGDYGI